MPHPLLLASTRLALPILMAAAVATSAAAAEATQGTPIDTGTASLEATLSRPLDVRGAAPGDAATSALTITSTGAPSSVTVTLTGTNPDGKGQRDTILVEAIPVPTVNHCTSALPFTRPTTATGDNGAALISNLRIDRNESAIVCIRVELPLATGNQYQASTTALDVHLHHTQEPPS